MKAYRSRRQPNGFYAVFCGDQEIESGLTLKEAAEKLEELLCAERSVEHDREGYGNTSPPPGDSVT